MESQSLRYTDTAPRVRIFAWSTVPADNGAPVTTLTAANTDLTSTRGLVDTVHPLAVATLGTWLSDGFVHRGNGIYDWYCPITVNAAGQTDVAVRASTLPAGVAIDSFIVTLTPDDLTEPATTSAAIATAVDNILADNFAAIAVGTPPSAATISTQVMTDLAGGGGTSARASIAAAVGAPSAATIATAVAAPSASTIAVTVETQLLDNFAALTPPTASAISTQVLADLAAGPGVAARGAIADSFLARAIQGAADGGRTVRDAFRFLRNRVSRNVGTGLVTVMTEDDATPAWTTQTTSSTAAAPIINSDPT